MKDTILEVRNLGFSFNNSSKKVFSDINFKVSNNEIVSILGPNGSGKTTLIKCILGFLKSTEGTSLIFNKESGLYTERELFKKISYVPQIKAFNYSYTVFEAVLLGRASHISLFGKPTELDEKIVKNTLLKLNIYNLKDKKCSEISGGEFQLVLIGRALCLEPRIIILDEPEANLDFRNQLLVMETLLSLKKENIACLFNTHNPSHALNYADKALLLYSDTRSIFGKVDDVVTVNNLKDAFNIDVSITKIDVNGSYISAVVPYKLGV